MSSDSDKQSSASLWQPVSGALGAGKVTDVTPEPIKSSSATVSSSASASTNDQPTRPVSPPASSSGAGSTPPRPPQPPSGGSAASGGGTPPRQPDGQPRRRGLGGLAASVVFVVAVLAVLYALSPHWLPALLDHAGIDLSRPAPAPAVAAAGMSAAERQKIDSQFADIDRRLNALKSMPGADPATADQIARLQAQIQQLAQQQKSLADRLGQLSATNAATPSAATADPALTQRLDDVQKRLEALDQASAANKGLRGDIDALTAELGKAADRANRLEQRLTELEKTAAARQNVDQRSLDAARFSAITALAARLRGNVEDGRPFAQELAALKPLLAGDKQLADAADALDSLSGGSAGTSALRQSFPQTARAIVAAGKDDAAESWWDRMLARLSSVVSVRRVGDVQGDSVEARVARAEIAINNNRLDQAVAELKPLTGKAAQAAAPWLDKAQKQLAAGQAADRLQALAGQRLAALEQR